MKKIVMCLMVSILALSSLAFADGITVEVNGKAVESEAAPFVSEESRTMIPVRFVAEALGAEVGWVAETSSVLITNNDEKITLAIGSNEITINGEVSTMDTAAVVRNERTYVPVRFISEALGYKVTWNGETKTVGIINEDDILKEEIPKIVTGNVLKFKDVELVNEVTKMSDSLYKDGLMWLESNSSFEGIDYEALVYIVQQESKEIIPCTYSWYKEDEMTLYLKFSEIVADETTCELHILDTEKDKLDGEGNKKIVEFVVSGTRPTIKKVQYKMLDERVPAIEELLTEVPELFKSKRECDNLRIIVYKANLALVSADVTKDVVDEIEIEVLGDSKNIEACMDTCREYLELIKTEHDYREELSVARKQLSDWYDGVENFGPDNELWGEYQALDVTYFEVNYYELIVKEEKATVFQNDVNAFLEKVMK